MPLKKCKECGQEISSEAEKCPHCGAKLRRFAWRLMRWPVSVLGAVVGGALIASIWYAFELPEQYIWTGALIGIVAGGAISFVFFRVVTVVLGVIAAGLIFFCLFFRVVTLSGDFTVIAKKHPTFSNTFVNLDDYIKRGNRAIEKHNADGRISSTQQRPLENYLLEQNLDVELWKEFMEKGLMVQKGKNKE